jgi:RNA polymerase sigma factor (sigma-70 family)
MSSEACEDRPDNELLDAWSRGDARAGSELFERHFEPVARFFQNKVGDDSDDLVSATFLGCIETRDRFRGQAGFRTFLFRIAHNKLFDHLRARDVAGRRFDWADHSIQDVAPGVHTMIARAADEEILLRALRSLPLDYQVALELHYWERMTADELAACLEIPPGTAKTRIRSGRMKLQKALATAAVEGAGSMTITNLDDWARLLRDRVLGPREGSG